MTLQHSSNLEKLRDHVFRMEIEDVGAWAILWCKQYKAVEKDYVLEHSPFQTVEEIEKAAIKARLAQKIVFEQHIELFLKYAEELGYTSPVYTARSVGQQKAFAQYYKPLYSPALYAGKKRKAGHISLELILTYSPTTWSFNKAKKEALELAKTYNLPFASNARAYARLEELTYDDE
ncbi:MAG: hypothetical protein OEY01_03610 [Desulfobulbaceae bacterium]|nr:hypothetical protein [Desulfobulbaceae bacterium]